jgi:hypothetical protein
MGLLGNLIKGTLNVVISPVVVVTDVISGDFKNSSKVVENVIDAVEEGVEDLTNGDLL